jgi:hypothetical protein
MKHAIRKPAIVLVSILLLMAVLTAAQELKQSPPLSNSMTIWQARRIVVMGNPAWNLDAARVERRSFRFTADNFEFDASRRAVSGEHFNVDLKKLMRSLSSAGVRGAS